ncbi:MAG TPA: carboxypeptidase M32 [Verrucomicrobiales bacterium]|nr:carboxypeptidase M32 [Verrucomicrobiales bacterium]
MNETPYQKLHRRFREVALVRSTGAILGWDQETYLPDKSGDWRADQLAWLAGQQHRLATAPEVAGWISECEASGFADGTVEATNIRGWRRDYDLAAKLPPEFVEELSRTTAQATHVWAEARKRSDFAHYQPMLEKLVRLVQEKADRLGWEGCRYDALLDEFEPGARTAEIAGVFATLGPAQSALVGPATEVSARQPEDLLKGDYPIAAQQAFNKDVAEAFGFDFKAGRIDTTAHPFCTDLGPLDTRLTTRYDTSDFFSSFYGVLHEAGHGLYAQGLSKDEWGCPAGDACSLGIHESQSRLWENHIGGSEAFWEHWLPRACHHFPQLAKFTPAQVAAAARRVSPSFIRVEADEVTYDLHIILRFELERRIINGDLPVADIPAAWNAKFRELLGLEVPDDARGCLQDIHWSFGGFGYFATYTLGNLNASQLMRAARRAHPSLDAELAKGEYATLLAWLRQNVHAPGRRYSAPDLMLHATGETTQAEYHLAYLRAKFL